jgi:hypothetical protein
LLSYVRAVSEAHNIVLQVHPNIITQSSNLAPTILGALGVLLALGSLVWQGFTFFRSGSRIRVVLRAGATNGMVVVTNEGAPSEDQQRAYQNQGLGTPVYGVEVLNAGRGSTSVASVAVAFGNGASYSGAYVAGSPELPFRMEGEHEETWYVDAANVVRAARAFEATMPSGKPHSIRGQVKLGGRKKPIRSKNSIRVL